ncbi:prepilin-type N-terminal cleavage/methylation domain-containing protein [Bacillus sp. UNC438CL73TsuS30]|uniref:prepilin-type N-terminal cleavage/methylation domain-containing protein n=1 Tax=Bacillus sp. UNC438CL73TsuS30 TaxID=1340434 RepID=UPI00068D7349|nr:prepilin-type N-terminal cleavage/methylation domain-containing protein [Bacillus sp. UNC438CL73TsuS30]
MVQALKQRMKEQKGFTLIELLAVIIILGIIAAIAIPAIGNVISKSDDKAKVQEALQIVNAAKYYIADKNPNATTNFTATASVPSGLTAANNVSLADYLDHIKDSNFVVTATYDQATGKYKYTITGHGAVSVVKTKFTTITTDYVSEQDLVNYSK